MDVLEGGPQAEGEGCGGLCSTGGHCGCPEHTCGVQCHEVQLHPSPCHLAATRREKR